MIISQVGLLMKEIAQMLYVDTRYCESDREKMGK